MTSTNSVWFDKTLESGASRLDRDESCDVCVVGAGIAGLTTAYRLACEGKSVIVLEGLPKIASGETAFTTAHLASVLDDRFSNLKKIHGLGVVETAHRSHAAAIDFIEATARTERIDCDFARTHGVLFPATKADLSIIDEEENVVREAGISVERIESLHLGRTSISPCLRFPHQGQFHPLKYLMGLAAAIASRGGRIFTDARVQSVEGGSNPSVTTETGRTVRAKAVVIATNAPLNGGVRTNLRIAAYTTYAIAGRLPASEAPEGLYWDTQDPYHYVRTQPAGEGQVWLIVGGEDHKTGQANDQTERWVRLEQWSRERFPALGSNILRWDGQIFETLDGLALIGPEPGGAKGIFIATGDSGMGMTHGTIAGLLLPSLIAGEAHAWEELYTPSRLPVNSLGTLVSEGANMAGRAIADYLNPGDVSSAEAIAPGCGAVVRSGLQKLAVYRNVEGSICELSAVCPHLGGIVTWNSADKTWDCPLHGSRFAPKGEVLHGPATEPLATTAKLM